MYLRARLNQSSVMEKKPLPQVALLHVLRRQGLYGEGRPPWGFLR